MMLSLALLAAQDAPAAGAPGFNLNSLLIQIGLVVAIFYFLLIRPQKKQRDAHEERLRKIRKGDEVVTAGGIIGKVENVKESIKDGATVPTMEDRITIRSVDSRFVVERGRIARVLSEPAATVTTTAESKSTT